MNWHWHREDLTDLLDCISSIILQESLVEVIPGEDSSQDTIARTVQYCRGLGKVVILCKDRPGFVVNRFFVPWLNEACLLLQEGIASAAAIDAVAMKAFRIGMGPCFDEPDRPSNRSALN